MYSLRQEYIRQKNVALTSTSPNELNPSVQLLDDVFLFRDRYTMMFEDSMEDEDTYDDIEGKRSV